MPTETSYNKIDSLLGEIRSQGNTPLQQETFQSPQMTSFSDPVNKIDSLLQEIRTTPQIAPEKQQKKGLRALEFVAKDLVGEAEEDESIGKFAKLGRNIYQSTVGSRGIAGVGQGLGKAILQVSNVRPLRKLSDQAQFIADQNNELIERFKETNDEIEKIEIKSIIKDNTAKMLALEEKRKRILASDDITAKEIIGSTGNALETIASFGLGSAASAATKVLPQIGKVGRVALVESALGGLAGISEPMSRGAKVTGKSIALGAVTGGTLPIVGNAIGKATRGLTQALIPNTLRKIAPDISDDAVNTATKKVRTAWEKAIKDKKSISDAVRKAGVQGTDVLETISKYTVVPDVDIRTGTASFSKEMDRFSNVIDEITDTLNPYIAKFNDIKVKTNELRDQAIKTIGDNPLIKASGTSAKVSNQISEMFADFSRTYGDELSPSNINEIRKAMNRKFRVVQEQAVEDSNKIIGDMMRETLDKITGDATIRNLNKEIKNLIQTVDVMKKMDGQKFGGGRLTQSLAQILGATIGSSGDLPFGISSLLGTLGGDWFVKLLRSMAFGSPIQRKIVKAIADTPKILDDLIGMIDNEADKKFIERLISQLKPSQLLPAPKTGVPQSQVFTPIQLPAPGQLSNKNITYLPRQ